MDVRSSTRLLLHLTFPFSRSLAVGSHRPSTEEQQYYSSALGYGSWEHVENAALAAWACRRRRRRRCPGFRTHGLSHPVPLRPRLVDLVTRVHPPCLRISLRWAAGKHAATVGGGKGGSTGPEVAAAFESVEPSGLE